MCSIARPGDSSLGKPFVKVNWMSGFDARGRPEPDAAADGQPTYPGNQGGTNWYSPSYSPRTNLFYISAWEDYASIYRRPARQGRHNFVGGGPRNLPVPGVPGVPGLAAHQSTRGRKPRATARSSRSIREPAREVEVQDDGRDGERHPHNRRRICSLPGAAKATSRR